MHRRQFLCLTPRSCRGTLRAMLKLLGVPAWQAVGEGERVLPTDVAQLKSGDAEGLQPHDGLQGFAELLAQADRALRAISATTSAAAPTRPR